MMRKEMEDKRTALAIVLSMLVVMVYSQLMLTQPTRPGTVQTNSAAGSQQYTQSNPENTSAIPAQITSTVAQTQAVTGTARTLPSRQELEAAGIFTIETETYRMQFSLLGGRIISLVLKEYRTAVEERSPLDLIKATPGGAFPLGITLGEYSDARLAYTVTQTTGASQYEGAVLSPLQGSDMVVELRGSLPSGEVLTKTLTLSPRNPVIKVNARLDRPVADNLPLWLEWTQFAPKDVAESRLDPKQFTWLTTGKSLETLAAAKTLDGQTSEIGASQWAVFSDKYFMEGIVSPDATNQFRLGSLGHTFFIRMVGSDQTINALIYAGPKDGETLKEIGYSLPRVIDLGFFSFLAEPLLKLLRLFYSLLGNYGLAIILLTLTLKLIFLPLTKASYKSMAAMQDIQPEVQALREKYKDATQLNQEMMALYKRKGVNPLGGCLPILIQIPVFFGLYSALLQSLELRHASFALWINDLSSPERLVLFGIPIPLMILLMGLSMILQQWTQPSAMIDPMQKRIMMMMPVIFTVMFIVFPMPAGLVLYWLVNNVISIIQQMYLRGNRKANPLVATVVASVIIFSFGFVLTLIS
jgi:YidC/Oxa1 family membrane protein insertase